jgi:hypothetical protein
MNYNSKIINKEIVLIIDIGLGLCEVADFLHKLSIEAPTSKLAKKFQSKPLSRHFTKPLL